MSTATVLSAPRTAAACGYTTSRSARYTVAGSVQPIRPAQYRQRPFTSTPFRARACVSQRSKQMLFACDRTEQLTGSSSGLDASVSSSGASGDGIHSSSMSSASARAMELQLPLFFLCTLPALAAEPGDFSQGSASSGSYYATLFLFVATLPGAALHVSPLADDTRHAQTRAAHSLSCQSRSSQWQTFL